MYYFIVLYVQFTGVYVLTFNIYITPIRIYQKIVVPLYQQNEIITLLALAKHGAFAESQIMTITLSPSDLVHIRIALSNEALNLLKEGYTSSSHEFLELRLRFDAFDSIIGKLKSDDFFNSDLVSISLNDETK